MLSVDEAIDAILARARPLPPVRRALRPARGETLAETVRADLDLPPFDKALMDGYAVRSADLSGPGEHRLRVVDRIDAGQTPSRPIEAGEAALIMTGAPMPVGADAVVMIERATEDGDLVILPGPVTPGQNRLSRGREVAAGEVVATPGLRIKPALLGLLASCGRAEIDVIPMPTIHVIPTGDELVPPGQKPGPGQIRDSNSTMLAALANDWGAISVTTSPIVPDSLEALREALGRGLDRDVLLVIGGVSAGRKDLIPATLVGLGVEPVFHKVRVKPGKPIWFGVGPDRPEGRSGTLVFGLPGNPASGVVGFLLFVRPALEALAGRPTPRDRTIEVRLARGFRHRGDRPTYHPARLGPEGAEAVDWAGSADLRAIATADGFLAFPAGDRDHAEGEVVRFLPLD